MAKKSAPSAGASPPPPPPQEATQVTVLAQYIKDFSFESPNVPQVFSSIQTPPEINLGVNVHTRNISPNRHEVLLNLKIEAKLQSKVAFIAELSYGGVFQLPDLQEEQLRLFLLIEGPRILFPFARGILTTAIRDGGFPHVMINPIDFVGLYMANKGNVGTMSAAGAA